MLNIKAAEPFLCGAFFALANNNSVLPTKKAKKPVSNLS